MNDFVLKYENVFLSYEKNNFVLKNINLTVKPKDFIFLTGKVGAGKTTFLKSIYGEIPIKKGNAKVLTFDLKKIKIWKIHKLRRQIGYIFQNSVFLNDKTVVENLEFVLKATGWKKQTEIKERIEQVLSEVDLNNKKNKYPFKLSTGERQRLSIARALLKKPKLILADEPTANLDLESANFIIKKLMDISSNGTAVILVSHDITTMSRYDVKKIVIDPANKSFRELNV